MALIKGTADADNLVTKNIGADTLYGYDGDDTLDGGGGANRLIGGLGNDRYILHSTSEVVVEQPGEGSDTIQASFSIDLRKAAYANVENVELTGFTALRIEGSSAANVLYGNAISNTINGYDGDDVIGGFGGNDSLDGGNGNDALYGGTGRDTLLGGAGNDTLTGDEGVDSLVGGTGDDTYNVDSASDIIKEAAGEGTDTVAVAYAGNVSLSKWVNVENLTLVAAGAAKITGTAVANVLRGNDSGDVIDGQDGDDTLRGGDGNDSLLGGAGNDVLYGSFGLDTLAGGAGDDTYDLSGWNSSAVVITDTDGGNDRIDFGTRAPNSLQFGRVGDDLTVTVSGSTMTVQSYFVAGANTIESFVTRFRTFSRADVLAAMSPGHVIHGTSGNDDLTAPDNAGPDTLVGGLGDDTYHIASSKDVVVEKAGEGTDTIYITLGNGSGYDLSMPDAAGVENLIATAGSMGYSALTGNALDNLIQGPQTLGTSFRGGQGNDTLMGGTGNDGYDFYLGDGQDVIDDAGGSGDVLRMFVSKDKLMAQRSGQDLTLKVRDTQDQITIKRWFDGPTNGIDLLYAMDISTSTSTLDRAAIDKMLQPGVQVNGTPGNDILTASGVGQGDTLVGGLGNDSYYLYSASDVVVEQPGQGTDTVVLNLRITPNYSLNTPELAAVENLTFLNSRNTTVAFVAHLTGNALDNQIGYPVADVLGSGSVLEGLDGNDTLYGARFARVTLVGGAGNDTYMVSYPNAPIIVEDADGGIDTIDESAPSGYGAGVVKLTDAQCANVENMICYSSSGIDVLQGNDLDNVLTILYLGGSFDGGKGNDTLVGNDMGSQYIGGLGNDEIRAGVGNDGYTYQAGDGQDTIIDQGGTDQLTLTDIAASDLRLSKSSSGQDLVIGFASHVADRITVSNWFGSADAQIESIVTSTGTVSSQSVNALLQAMAAGGAGVGVPAGSVLAPATVAAAVVPGNLLAA